jgi:hypothetical protein
MFIGLRPFSNQSRQPIWPKLVKRGHIKPGFLALDVLPHEMGRPKTGTQAQWKYSAASAPSYGGNERLGALLANRWLALSVRDDG